MKNLKVVVPRRQQDSEAVACKFDCAIPKGVLTQDAATDGPHNVQCNLQHCNGPDLISFINL